MILCFPCYNGSIRKNSPIILYHNTPDIANHRHAMRRFPMEKPNHDDMKKRNQDNDEQVINGKLTGDEIVLSVYSKPDPKPYD